MDECSAQRLSLAKEFKPLQNFFTAMGDATRQQVFLAILENETTGIRAPEIAKRTHLSRASVSHHLRILRNAGLIGMYRKGAMNFYYAAADTETWDRLRELTEHICQVTHEAVRQNYPDIEPE